MSTIKNMKGNNDLLCWFLYDRKW